MNRWIDRLFLLTWGVSVPMMIGALYMVFFHAPDEKVMGAAQRIFYFHVPSAMMTYASVFVLLGGSVGYLWTRDLRWDNLSRAATEVALLFCTVVLITGPIWAKPAWGVWWTWEARLTSTLILWLLLLACLMVRNYADSRDLGARLAAIVGIVAAVDVPIIHKAVTWWRGQHPEVFKPGADRALDPRMLQTFVFCIITFLIVFAVMLMLRWRVAQVEDRADAAVDMLATR